MPKVNFEDITEALSVPAFHVAYRELGMKHGLWGKGIDELVDFFDSLSGKSLRRIAKAFGLRLIVTGDWRLEIYVGDLPGLLIIDTSVPPEAREPKGEAFYECPCCGRRFDPDFLHNSTISAIACLYTDRPRITKLVTEFCMVQPIDIAFPYSGKKRWQEADVQRILAEGVLAKELELPEILSPQQLEELTHMMSEKLGFDFKRWAETRARNIRQGIEAMPDLYGYKRVEE